MDISAVGALLAAEEPLRVGSRAHLQLALGGLQFEGQVQIKREQPSSGAREHQVGVVVTPSLPQHQQALEQFLRRADNGQDTKS